MVTAVVLIDAFSLATNIFPIFSHIKKNVILATNTAFVVTFENVANAQKTGHTTRCAQFQLLQPR